MLCGETVSYFKFEFAETLRWEDFGGGGVVGQQSRVKSPRGVGDGLAEEGSAGLGVVAGCDSDDLGGEKG